MIVPSATPCAYCPRLCRHACPVAVATGLESAVPATIFATLHAYATGREDADVARSAASLCLGCGACTDACVPAVPVAARIREWRRALGEDVAADPVGAIEGDAPHVCVLGPDEDWPVAWSASRGLPHAALRTRDSLGHARWAADADASEKRLASLRQAFQGRVAVVASGDVAEVLRAAGVAVERLQVVAGGRARFRTCFESGEGAGAPGQLACCGRREGFAEREPGAARDVARANVRAFAGDGVACGDEGCARWLRAHGADVLGPADALAPGGCT